MQQRHILDKDVSVDEDILAVPLEPIRTNSFNVVKVEIEDCNNEEEEEKGEQLPLSSILRRESSTFTATRKVSFPVHDDKLAIYREPERCFPWAISKLYCIT